MICLNENAFLRMIFRIQQLAVKILRAGKDNSLESVKLSIRASYFHIYLENIDFKSINKKCRKIQTREEYFFIVA